MSNNGLRHLCVNHLPSSLHDESVASYISVYVSCKCVELQSCYIYIDLVNYIILRLYV